MNSTVSPHRPGTILVLEDEIELSTLFGEILTQAGYSPVFAHSVTDALGILGRQHFDAAILDIELRDGVVFPVADRLNALGVPLLFASAVYFQIVPRQYQASRFIAKPFAVDALLAELEAAIRDGHRPAASNA